VGAGRRRALAAIGLASGFACASCNGLVTGLAENAPMFLMDPGPSAARNRGVGAFSSVGPEKCHPVESVVISGGERVPSYGRACEMPDGSWVVTASSDAARATEAISGSSAPPQRAGLYGPPGYAMDDPWCSTGRRGFMMGPFGPGFGPGFGGYGGGFGFSRVHRGHR
jgi:hypothetical protein